MTLVASAGPNLDSVTLQLQEKLNQLKRTHQAKQAHITVMPKVTAPVAKPKVVAAPVAEIKVEPAAEIKVEPAAEIKVEPKAPVPKAAKVEPHAPNSEAAQQLLLMGTRPQKAVRFF